MKCSIYFRLLLFFVYIMKQMTSKPMMNGSLLVSKTTENQIKIQMSELGHFSPIPVFLSIACISLLCCCG